MTEPDAYVFVDLGGVPHLVGRLWSHQRRTESATFEYAKEWLANPACFSLEPALSVGGGAFHTDAGKALFGAIGDSAPDRWGRVLMRRAERQRASAAGSTPRTLREIDFLLQVDDESRAGALRFTTTLDGPFVADDSNPIPPLVELPRLLGAAVRIVDDEEDVDEDLRLLLAPGSSLGGARPKASVRDHDGSLAIAKFPHRDDESSAVLWEHVLLTLASNAGINVSEHRVEMVNDDPVLILRRFDRWGSQRVPQLSAMSMLGATDNDVRSYMEIADVLRRHGAMPADDARQLWKRMVFNILCSNTDDHLRNHAFLYSGSNGWTLSPAYDLNPVPVDVKPRVLATAIDLDDATASLELAMSVAGYFDLNPAHAQQAIAEVAHAQAEWRAVAGRVGIKKAEIKRMESAFEHPDAEQARRLLG